MQHPDPSMTRDLHVASVRRRVLWGNDGGSVTRKCERRRIIGISSPLESRICYRTDQRRQSKNQCLTGRFGFSRLTISKDLGKKSCIMRVANGLREHIQLTVRVLGLPRCFFRQRQFVEYSSAVGRVEKADSVDGGGIDNSLDTEVCGGSQDVVTRGYVHIVRCPMNG